MFKLNDKFNLKKLSIVAVASLALVGIGTSVNAPNASAKAKTWYIDGVKVNGPLTNKSTFHETKREIEVDNIGNHRIVSPNYDQGKTYQRKINKYRNKRPHHYVIKHPVRRVTNYHRNNTSYKYGYLKKGIYHAYKTGYFFNGHWIRYNKPVKAYSHKIARRHIKRVTRPKKVAKHAHKNSTYKFGYIKNGVYHAYKTGYFLNGHWIKNRK